MGDVYFSDAWGRLHEAAEGGELRTFTIEDPRGLVSHMFIYRKVDIPGFEGYDITTPYGYGGPRVDHVDVGDSPALVKRFRDEFSVYCNDHQIVSEFVRFHPLVSNAKTFATLYDLSAPRATIGTNLEKPISEEFGKSCRKNIRKALNAGVTYAVTVGPERIEGFKDVYYDTMNRNQAKDFYYFPESYFDQLCSLFGDQVVTVEARHEGRLIAMNLCLAADSTIHIHLSGTREGFLHLSPAYVLRYGIALWGNENDFKLIHHGGGRSNAPEDSLLRFKSQFGRGRFEFVTGSRVWNAKKYSQACRKAGTELNGHGFFPAYRGRR